MRERRRENFSRDMGTGMLRAAIIGVSLVFIVLALLIDNTWILAGILAYEVLP